MVFPRHGMHLSLAWTQELSILHLKKFGLVVHNKNQRLAQKRNPKGNIMIKPTQQSSRISGKRGSLAQERNQIKKRICQKYNDSTIENMVTTWITILSLRKGRKQTKHQLPKKGNPQRNPSRIKQTSSSSQDNNILL